MYLEGPSSLQRLACHAGFLHLIFFYSFFLDTMCSVLPPYVAFHGEHHTTVHTICLWHLGLGWACVTVALPIRTLTIHRWISFLFFLVKKKKKFKSFNLETLVMLHEGTHRAVINLLQLASTKCVIGPAYPHRAIVNLLQLASTQCGFGPVCAPRAVINLLQPDSTQCGVGPAYTHRAIFNLFHLPQLNVVLVQCVPHRADINLLQPASILCGVGPMYTHRAIFNLFQLASTQCGVGPVCAP